MNYKKHEPMFTSGATHTDKISEVNVFFCIIVS